MSITLTQLVKVSIMCDFDYSKYSDEQGEYAKCELTLSGGGKIDEHVLSLMAKIVNYLSRVHNVDLNQYLKWTVENDVINLKLYASVMSHGLSLYDIVHKIALLLDFTLSS